MNKYLFVSYAHKDRKIVENAIKALESKGACVWYDKGISAGSDWAQNVGSHLKDASLVLLFLSKNSAKSENVRREIRFANENHIPILTVQIGKVKLDDELTKELTVNQFVNMKNYRTYGAFASGITPNLQAAGVINEEPKPVKDKKIKYPHGTAVLIVIAAIIVIIAAIVLINKIFFANVPTVRGMITDPAKLRVEEDGFACDVAADYTDEEEFGYIFRQNLSGKNRKKSNVVITESLGPEVDLTEVPNVTGFHISDAAKKLVDAGMLSFIITPVRSLDFQIGYVVTQSIPAGYKVSTQNRIELQVSSTEGTVVDIFGQPIRLGTKKVEIIINPDNLEDLTATPLDVYGIGADYSETTAISADGSVTAAINVMVSTKREDKEPFGTYRGNITIDCRLDGESSLLWTAIKAALAEDDEVRFYANSDSFSYKLEPWDEQKYHNWVISMTGSSDAIVEYASERCMAMALGNGIVMNSMNKTMRTASNVVNLINMLNVGLPDIEGDVLKMPYSVVLYDDGRVWICLYSANGATRSFNFHGTVSMEQ